MLIIRKLLFLCLISFGMGGHAQEDNGISATDDGPSIQMETVDLQENSCTEMHLVDYSFYSTSKLEEFLISELRANFREFGVLNWDCIIQEFESQSERASVWVIPNGGQEGADVIRFKLDRSDSFFAVIASFGPGNSNGVFQAIFNVTPMGEVAIIRRGGEARWLR